jgi:endonuclease V-like protein UPF0215 family
MSDVTLKINSTTNKTGSPVFQGTVALPGVRPTKLTRKDQTTEFGTRAALVNSARNFAKNIGYSLVVDQPTAAARKAAKKAVKTTGTTGNPVN